MQAEELPPPLQYKAATSKRQPSAANMAIQEISAKSAEPQPVPKEQVIDDSQEQLLDEERLEKVFIGSIDQGTTSTRFIIFDGMGEVSLLLYAP